MTNAKIQEAVKAFQNKIEEKWEEDNAFSLKFLIEHAVSIEDIKVQNIKTSTVSDAEYENEYNLYTFDVQMGEKLVRVDYLDNIYIEDEIPNDFFPNANYKLHANKEFGTNGREVFLYNEKEPEFELDYAAVKLFNLVFEDELDEELYKLLNEVKEAALEDDDKEFYEKYKSVLPGVIKITGSHYNQVTLYFSTGAKIRAEKHDIEYSHLQLENDVLRNNQSLAG